MQANSDIEVIGKTMAYFHKLLAKLKQKKPDDSRLNINPYMVPLLVGSDADVHFWSPSNDRFSQTEIGLVQLMLKTLYFISINDLKTAQEVGISFIRAHHY